MKGLIEKLEKQMEKLILYVGKEKTSEHEIYCEYIEARLWAW